MIDKNNCFLLANMVGNALPEGYGFCLLLFSFGDTEDKLQYISNANRDDIVKAMKEWISKVDNDNYGKDV